MAAQDAPHQNLPGRPGSPDRMPSASTIAAPSSPSPGQAAQGVGQAQAQAKTASGGFEAMLAALFGEPAATASGPFPVAAKEIGRAHV